jgi:beta-mannosidase
MQRKFGEPPGRVFTPESVGYRHLGEDMGRFISEFGVHAIPSRRTLERYIDPDDLHLGSPVMREHDKNIADGRLDMYLDAHAPPRTDLDEQIWWSQFCQAEALKLAIETARSRMWSCSGVMFWQWNDCWPAISWSVLDVDLRPKSGFWAARRAWAPLLACAIDRGDHVDIRLVNDGPDEVAPEVRWELRGFDGAVHASDAHHDAVAARTSHPVGRIDTSRLSPTERQDRFVAVLLDDELVSRTLLCEPRDLRRSRPRLEVTWGQDGDEPVAVLMADGHALAVRLEADDPAVLPEDSWFDLLPGVARRVHVRHRCGEPVDPADIEVTWS